MSPYPQTGQYSLCQLCVVHHNGLVCHLLAGHWLAQVTVALPSDLNLHWYFVQIVLGGLSLDTLYVICIKYQFRRIYAREHVLCWVVEWG